MNVDDSKLLENDSQMLNIKHLMQYDDDDDDDDV